MSVATMPARGVRARAAVSASPAPGTAPLVALIVLLALTAIVPQQLQSRATAGGLLASDLVLGAALAWAAVDLAWRRMDRRTCWVLGGLALFVVVVLAQELRALSLGRPLSGSGGEARVLLDLGTLFIALPLLAEADGRLRLGRALVGLALVLGAWGLLQPLFGLVYDRAPDTGASTTLSYETAGRTIGMFAFPVAVLCALAALAVRAPRTLRGDAILVVVVLVNFAATVLAFERTFVIALGIGLVVLAVRIPSPGRARLLLAGAAGLALSLFALWALVPDRLSAAEQRLASVTQHASDPSVRYREVESRLVLRHIAASPVTGDAMGATMRIGRPGTEQPIVDRRYAENGYLWLAWKTGVPAAVLVCLVLAAAATAPGRRRLPDAPGRALALGAQASLVMLAVATVTFAAFAHIAITAVIGVLAACCLAPLPREPA